MRLLAFALLFACAPEAAAPQGKCEPRTTSLVTYGKKSVDEDALGKLIREMDTTIAETPMDPKEGSSVLEEAQKLMTTKKWNDAVTRLYMVLRGEAKDGREHKQIAQYELAVCLFNLEVFTESHDILRKITLDQAHPRKAEALDMIKAEFCGQ